MQARKKVKVVFIGREKAGKTSLIEKYCYDEISLKSSMTVGMPFYLKELKTCDIHIQDTSGNVGFSSWTNLACHNANAIVCVIDHNHKEGEAGIREDIYRMENALRVSPDAELHVVISKSDLNYDAVAEFKIDTNAQIEKHVLKEDSSPLKNKAIKFTITSAFKNGAGITKFFDDVVASTKLAMFKERRPSTSLLFVEGQSSDAKEQKRAQASVQEAQAEHTSQLHVFSF